METGHFSKSDSKLGKTSSDELNTCSLQFLLTPPEISTNSEAKKNKKILSLPWLSFLHQIKGWQTAYHI
jgi:hypothetical protein